jgi:Cu+-exporting ATPase
VHVLERMAAVGSVVFDKTGTLTSARGGGAVFQATGAPLSETERRAVHALTRQSTHPHSVRINEACQVEGEPASTSAFRELTGKGVEGTSEGVLVQLGSIAWLTELGYQMAQVDPQGGSLVGVAINGVYRGCFVLHNTLRPEVAELLSRFQGRFQLALLSGDHDRERASLAPMFGCGAILAFQQNPLDKLDFVRRTQESGQTVMMVGDGLNDAGALRQSDVGVAVVERVGAFSPASDVILEGSQVARLADIVELARRSVRIIHLSFRLSALYNLIGIGFAALGLLSPLVAAILMPVSSFSVVLFACGLTTLAARKLNFDTRHS